MTTSTKQNTDQSTKRETPEADAAVKEFLKSKKKPAFVHFDRETLAKGAALARALDPEA